MFHKIFLIGGGLCCLTTLSIAGWLGVAVWNGSDPGQAVHTIAHGLRICRGACGSAAGNAATASGTPGRCWLLGSSSASRADAQAGAGDDNKKKIVDYLSDRVMAENRLPDVTRAEIQSATGASLAGFTEAELRAAVYLELLRRGADVDSLCGAPSCSRLSACSVQRNLAGAAGEDLARYEQERSRDGETYADWNAPDFTLPATDGSLLSLAGYRGRPVALVLLAGHCNHSLQMLPLLSKLNRRYQGRGLAILPVYVHSGSVEDVRAWTTSMALSTVLLVDENDLLPPLYESSLVPSTFLIARDGRVVKRLVGFKNTAELAQELDRLLPAGEGA
ncbi:MAG: peroxiredoxin family protein [Acidobacteriota bacterium]